MTPKRKPARKRCSNCGGAIGAEIGADDGCMATRRCLASRPVPGAPLPRAVRELLRDVVLWHRTDDDLPTSEDMANRAERILGVPWERIVAQARKAGRR